MFVSGGPWHVAALGLLLAGIAVPAAFYRLLPRAMWVTGLLLAMVCELSILTLAADPAVYLLPVGRFGALVWLIGAGSLLPRTRSKRALG